MSGKKYHWRAGDRRLRENACATFIQDDIVFFSEGWIEDLIDGTLISDCLLPCRTTQTHTELLKDYKSDESYLDISFSSIVTVTKTDLVTPTLSTFLSEVGMKVPLIFILIPFKH